MPGRETIETNATMAAVDRSPSAAIVTHEIVRHMAAADDRCRDRQFPQEFSNPCEWTMVLVPTAASLAGNAMLRSVNKGGLERSPWKPRSVRPVIPPATETVAWAKMA